MKLVATDKKDGMSRVVKKICFKEGAQASLEEIVALYVEPLAGHDPLSFCYDDLEQLSKEQLPFTITAW